MDFEEISEKCGIGIDTLHVVCNKISLLSDSYSEKELNQIYNCLLVSLNDIDILNFVINLSADCRSDETLSILIDLLLKKDIDGVDSERLVQLRTSCVKAITKYKSTTSLNALLYCLNNKNENYKLRLACADALGRIGDTYAVAPLINVINDENEKSVYVKESATFALGLLGDKSAIDPLISIIEAKQGLLDKFSFLKEKIIEALGKLAPNNEKVIKVYKTSLMDASPFVRINTIEALMNGEYEESEELIRTALNDENDEVKKNALIALYNIVGKNILDEVISLPSYSSYLKEEAKNLLDQYEDDENE